MGLPETLFLVRLERLAERFEEMLWLRAAVRSGAFDALARGDQTPGSLARALGGDSGLTEAFLSTGCACGWVQARDGRYALTRRGARLASRPGFQALVLYVGETRERSLRILPDVLRGAGRPGLDPAAATIIAEVSALAAPYAIKFLKRLPGLDRPGARFLDVGCGTADYLIALSGRFPTAQSFGLDLDPNVVVVANDRVQRAGVGGRVQVRTGDVRTAPLDPPYRLILVNQILHYLGEAERRSVLERLASCLEAGGHLALQQVVKPPGRVRRLAAFFDLSLSMHAGMSRLPTPEEVLSLLRGAGLEPAPPRRIAHLANLLLFIARRP